MNSVFTTATIAARDSHLYQPSGSGSGAKGVLYRTIQFSNFEFQKDIGNRDPAYCRIGKTPVFPRLLVSKITVAMGFPS